MTTDYEFDLLCIGSGPAGQRAAIQAAKLGKRAAVVEKRPSMGGVCLDMGTIPSKAFREVVWSLSQSGGGFNRDSALRLDGENMRRPPAEVLLQRVGTVGRRESQVIEQQLFRNEVQMIRGEASVVNSGRHALQPQAAGFGFH